MSEPINIVMLLLIISAICGGLALSRSADALERLGRRMRARARALNASREAWDAVYQSSLRKDAQAAEDETELWKLFTEESARLARGRA